MYKTSKEYYIEPIAKTIKYSHYKGPQLLEKTYLEETQSKETQSKETQSKETQSKDHSKSNDTMGCSHIIWKTSKYENMSNPLVWGPAFWFTLHNGASKYPISASPLVKNRMKSFIIGIPVMVTCEKCAIHANTYIETKNLYDICSGREKLFEFFVHFHNSVNKRLNKSIVSVEEAYKIYNGSVQISTMSYQK
jgi:hypothetical protein